MKTTILCILDGFGFNPKQEGNAIALAKKPNFDAIWETNPHTTLCTHGIKVGLPEGQMGNSEVGHLNIGAGRVVEQWLMFISNRLRGSALTENQNYQSFISNSKDSPQMHLVGLYSDGGVHSHLEHLQLLLPRIRKDYSGKICLHLITDGRDVSPTSSLEQIKSLEKSIATIPDCVIASVSGRYYAMDRDKRWDRTLLAYEAIARGKGVPATTASEHIANSYKSGITDEFLLPATINPVSIKAQDSILFWNFRSDRMRQIVSSLAISEFDGFQRTAPVIGQKNILCFTNYEKSFGLPFLFSQEKIKNHLGETISAQGLAQLRVAETEKYPHVTFFFNGLSDDIQPGEERKLLPSPRDVKTYDLKPEMSAFAVKDTVLEAIRSGKFPFIVVNFANCDMVGHTGVVTAGIKAVETVDQCLGEIAAELKKIDGQALIIADHGNAEQMINYEDGKPHTAHTLFPVPCIAFNTGKQFSLKDGGALCDVAPTILKMMEITQPKEMTGQALF